MTFIKKFAEFSKEYFSVIAIFPLVLGGLWQMILLISISPSYIRFFSISQQLSDGLLVLYILLIVNIPIFILGLNDRQLKKGKEEFEKEEPIREVSEKEKVKIIIRHILVAFGGITLILSFLGYIHLKGYINIYNFFDTEPFEISRLTLLIFIISYLGVMIYRVIIFSLMLIVLFSERRLIRWIINFVKGEIVLGIIASGLIMVTFLVLAYILDITVAFHKKYFLPADSINFNNFLLNAQKKYPKKNLSIRYFNDKYVFLEIDEKIEIYKFEDILPK